MKIVYFFSCLLVASVYVYSAEPLQSHGIIDEVRVLQQDVSQLKTVLQGAIVATPKPCEQLGDRWVRYQKGDGRFLLGHNQAEKDIKYQIDALGGQKTVTLEPDEMPSHNHRIATNNQNNGNTDIHNGLGGSTWDGGILQKFQDIPDKPGWNTVLPNVLERTGKNRPHDNMPPYRVVYFCIYQ